MKNIKEYIVEALSNTQIFEMAYERSKYIDLVSDLSTKITEHWCLLRYSTLNGKLKTHNHWVGELRAFVMRLANIKIKVDKTKATKESLIKYEELDDWERVIRIISNKWYEEGFDIESEQSEEVAKDFAEYGVHDLIDIICNPKIKLQEINNYLNSI